VGHDPAKRGASRKGTPVPFWKPTQDLRDFSAALSKSAKKAARKAPAGGAEALALDGLKELFLGLKRVALTQQARPRFEALGEETAERFAAMFPGSRDLRPGQVYDAPTLFEVRAGAGLTAPLNGLAGGTTLLGIRHTVGTTLSVNDDGNLFTKREFGFGAGLHLSAGILPWVKVLTGSFTATFNRIRGRFTRNPDPAVAFRSMLKEATETNARGLTGKYIARSAGWLTRWWDNWNQARKRASIWKVRGVFFNYPKNIPAWAVEGKLAKGLSMLPLHRAAKTIGQAAGPKAEKALRRSMQKHFPTEAQVQDILAQHLDSPEKIRTLSNKNNDVAPSLIIAASNAQLERGSAIKETAFEANASMTAAPLVLVNGTASGDVSHQSSTISTQTGAAQNTLVNAATTQDPALGLAALGALCRDYGATTNRRAHPALGLMEAMQPAVPSAPRDNIARDRAFADRFLGPRSAMSPYHAELCSALQSGVDPAAVMAQANRRLRRLIGIYQSFRKDADQLSGGDAQSRATAAFRINQKIFGGGYKVGDDEKARRNFLADAQTACTLSLTEIDLTLTMAKTFMAASSRRQPKWKEQSLATDMLYRAAHEIMSDSSLPPYLETIHRRQAFKSSSTLRQHQTSGEVKLDANLFALPNLLETIPGIGTYIAAIPLLPQPLKFETSLSVSHDYRPVHYDPEQAGTFDSAEVTFAGPPPSGILVRLLQFARNQRKGGPSADEDDLTRLRSDLRLAVKAISPQDLLGNDLSGLRYEWRRHTPPDTDGRALAPETAYTRWYQIMVNDQILTTPNPFAYTHTPLAVLDGVVAPSAASARTLVERIGSDQGYVQKRMASDIGKLFVEGPDGKLDARATAKRFRKDNYRREALFGSKDVPILAVLFQIASLDRRNLDKRYTNIKGETTDYANPTVQYLKGDRGRMLRFGNLASRLAAGSGQDPVEADPGRTNILDMLHDAERRQSDNPALLDEMQALYRQARSWTAEETLDFFTQTPEGRAYLQWFHDVAKAKTNSIGDMKGDPAYGPQINHDLFRIMPVVEEAAGFLPSRPAAVAVPSRPRIVA
jgi:hypothetical protein